MECGGRPEQLGMEMAADEVAPIQAVEREGPSASAASSRTGTPMWWAAWCGQPANSVQRTFNIRQQKWGSGARGLVLGRSTHHGWPRTSHRKGLIAHH